MRRRSRRTSSLVLVAACLTLLPPAAEPGSARSRPVAPTTAAVPEAPHPAAVPRPAIPAPASDFLTLPGTVIAGGRSRQCLGYNGLNRDNPPRLVLTDRVKILGRPPVRVGRGTDVDWTADPYGNVSWRMWFQSLTWTGGLIDAFESRGDHSALRRAAGIARDWVTDHPPVRGIDRRGHADIAESAKFRLNTLMCLRTHHAAAWLDAAIDDHAGFLADERNWSGPWNHGTDESRSLLGAACLTGRRDLAELAYRRLLGAVFAPGEGVRPAIDDQGANNEQSAGYAYYNLALWRRVAAQLRGCGHPVPAELDRRLELLAEFVAFHVTPSGDLVQIGESYAKSLTGRSEPGAPALDFAASRGARGRPPTVRARVYRAGYVLGRSAWVRPDATSGAGARAGAGAVHYTARFGPGRYAHGQDDHMSVTFYAKGRDIIVPSGHIGYNHPAWRAWLRSPRAHNTLVPLGTGFSSRAPTALTGARFEPGADTFSFADSAFTGTLRRRSVLVASGPDVMAVLDRARSATPREVVQLWHLPPGFRASTGPGPGHDGGHGEGAAAVARAGDIRVHFMRVPLPALAGRPLPTRIRQGERDPAQGWIARRPGRVRPAPVVEIPASGSDVRLLTLVVPVRGGARPRSALTPAGAGTYAVELTVPGDPSGRLTFQVSPDGALRRTR